MPTIPSIIHYCWFGKNPKPTCFSRCLDSWRRFAPECRIREWNETNLPFSEAPFLRAAIAAEAWAFVSDFVRVQILAEHGGVYVDTDLELTAPLTPLLKNRAFLEFEKNTVAFGIVGAEPEHPLLQRLQEQYRAATFPAIPGETPRTIVNRTTDLLIDEYGLRSFGGEVLLRDGVRIYPADVLLVDSGNGRNRAIHWYAASWKSDFDRDAFLESVKHDPPAFPGRRWFYEQGKRWLQLHAPALYRKWRDRAGRN